MNFLGTQRKLLSAWCKNKSREGARQRDLEQRDAARKAARAAARSCFAARRHRFAKPAAELDGRQ